MLLNTVSSIVSQAGQQCGLHIAAHPAVSQTLLRASSLALAATATRLVPRAYSLMAARSLASTSGPFQCHPSVAFDAPTMATFEQRIARHSMHAPKLKYKYDTQKVPLRKASVLIPLCTHRGNPAVLFTVRSQELRKHRGEVSFPGGVQDETDSCLNETALRETFEEVGIPPSQVKILGDFPPVPDRESVIEITPTVGFIGEIDDPKALCYNPSEVSEVFLMTLDELTDKSKHKCKNFKCHCLGVRMNGTVWEKDDKVIRGLTAHILENTLNTLLHTKV
ncbi:NUDIX hydrolase domain-like protein [Polychytrium aggregatum]|uniref:NUDIX hydrolase domain-like protein n=1 Tax=Polychytrium aggregatum TaxID=110093 RepID=UPI0022FE255A|nr:NUDIX hydrolase domain-like protein [Polychytrium aggregatum]KAI9207289.1 NUDIX hydrolase domain-like protein [Polychytrium aggregatum]